MASEEVLSALLDSEKEFVCLVERSILVNDVDSFLTLINFFDAICFSNMELGERMRHLPSVQSLPELQGLADCQRESAKSQKQDTTYHSLLLVTAAKGSFDMFSHLSERGFRFLQKEQGQIAWNAIVRGGSRRIMSLVWKAEDQTALAAALHNHLVKTSLNMDLLRFLVKVQVQSSQSLSLMRLVLWANEDDLGTLNQMIRYVRRQDPRWAEHEHPTMHTLTQVLMLPFADTCSFFDPDIDSSSLWTEFFKQNQDYLFMNLVNKVSFDSTASKRQAVYNLVSICRHLNVELTLFSHDSIFFFLLRLASACSTKHVLVRKEDFDLVEYLCLDSRIYMNHMFALLLNYVPDSTLFDELFARFIPKLSGMLEGDKSIISYVYFEHVCGGTNAHLWYKRFYLYTTCTGLEEWEHELCDARSDYLRDVVGYRSGADFVCLNPTLHSICVHRCTFKEFHALTLGLNGDQDVVYRMLKAPAFENSSMTLTLCEYARYALPKFRDPHAFVGIIMMGTIPESKLARLVEFCCCIDQLLNISIAIPGWDSLTTTMQESLLGKHMVSIVWENVLYHCDNVAFLNAHYVCEFIKSMHGVICGKWNLMDVFLHLYSHMSEKRQKILKDFREFGMKASFALDDFLLTDDCKKEIVHCIP